MRQKRKVLRLRQLRRAREMSQAELGKRVGLQKTTIADIESGRTRPSLTKAELLAGVFGVTIDEAFRQVEIAAP